MDIPLPSKLSFEYDDFKNEKTDNISWSPYEGGFIDFAKLGTRRAFVQHYPNHTDLKPGSVKDSLLWRLKQPELFLSQSDAVCPVETILQRIALSNWSHTLSFLQRDFDSVDLGNLTDEAVEIKSVKQTLVDLESWRNLLDRCSAIMRTNLAHLDISTKDNPTVVTDADSNAKMLRMDWEFIWHELRHCIGETDRLVSRSLASLSVQDSKRSRDDSEKSALISQLSAMESVRSNQLNKLAQLLLLVFTPAAFAYGLLSMGGDFSPGNKKFWVFFAIAIPLSMATFFVFLLWTRLTNVRSVRRQDYIEDE